MDLFEEAQLDLKKMLEENIDRIRKTKFKVAAIHPARITAAQINQKLSEDPEWSSLDIEYLADLAAQLFLVELETSDLGITKVLISDTSQANDEGQAPFLEKYFDLLDNALSFAEDDFIDMGPSLDIHEPGRVRFYMHYFDPLVDLIVGDCRLTLPAATPMPSGLSKLMPYQPPN